MSISSKIGPSFCACFQRISKPLGETGKICPSWSLQTGRKTSLASPSFIADEIKNFPRRCVVVYAELWRYAGTTPLGSRFHRFNDGHFDRDDRFHHFHHFNNETFIFVDSFGFPFFYPFSYFGYYPYGYYPSYGYYGYDYYGKSADRYGYGTNSRVAEVQRRLARAGLPRGHRWNHGTCDSKGNPSI
jgi:hypothetical protein